MKEREINKIVTGEPGMDGAGVKLTRVLGHGTIRDFDPFLMMDAFDSKEPDDYSAGFPWHPHRGIETFTYLMAGRIDHGDSLGNAGTIVGGSAQWMTAGSGIIHQEMPQPEDWMLGVQLWINLPQKDKMTHPAYRDIQNADIPKVQEDGVKIAVVAGKYKDAAGPVQGDYVKTVFLDVALEPGISWAVDTDPSETCFLYTVLGSCRVGKERETDVPAKRAVLFGAGSRIHLQAGQEGLRALLVSAKPLKESVAWGGPVVMNTEEEVRHAFDEIKRGAFIKHKNPKHGG